VDIIAEKIKEASLLKNTKEMSVYSENHGLRRYDILNILEYLHEHHEYLSAKETTAAMLLLDGAIRDLRYKIDINNDETTQISKNIESFLNKNILGFSSHIMMGICQLMFDQQINIEIEPENIKSDQKPKDNISHIVPNLQEFLESLRRGKHYKNAFELYELLVGYIYVFSVEMQLDIIAELAVSSKKIIHEASILMVLHPKKEVRAKVPFILKGAFNKQIFTAVDLRRLIVMRNWLPEEERTSVDGIISLMKQESIMPAPCFPTKIINQYASVIDGSGACILLFESKIDNKRNVFGFVAKIGIGIKEPWIYEKVHKGFIKDVLGSLNAKGVDPLNFRNVGDTYIEKVIKNTLAYATDSNRTPDPNFLKISELYGAKNWQPEKINADLEVNNLKKYYTSITTDDHATMKALSEGRSWLRDHKELKSWFDERKAVDYAINSQSDNTISKFYEHALERWKIILLFTCLYFKSCNNNREDKYSFAVLLALSYKNPPENIPMLHLIAQRSLSHKTMNKIFDF